MISEQLQQTLDAVPDEVRKERIPILDQLITFIKERKDEPVINLVFICTHNSRRSHLAQIWAQVYARQTGWLQIQTYSGGTEATAMHPNTVDALSVQGFELLKHSNTNNPIYWVKTDGVSPVMACFSKTYDHGLNPKAPFAAVMTCDEADANCPFIPGAAARISLTYEDPKRFDNNPEVLNRYLETSRLIASEMKYVFGQL